MQRGKPFSIIVPCGSAAANVEFSSIRKQMKEHRSLFTTPMDEESIGRMESTIRQSSALQCMVLKRNSNYYAPTLGILVFHAAQDLSKCSVHFALVNELEIQREFGHVLMRRELGNHYPIAQYLARITGYDFILKTVNDEAKEELYNFYNGDKLRECLRKKELFTW